MQQDTILFFTYSISLANLWSIYNIILSALLLKSGIISPQRTLLSALPERYSIVHYYIGFLMNSLCCARFYPHFRCLCIHNLFYRHETCRIKLVAGQASLYAHTLSISTLKVLIMCASLLLLFFAGEFERNDALSSKSHQSQFYIRLINFHCFNHIPISNNMITKNWM